MEDRIYVVGNARTALDNPITKLYKKFFIAFIISYEDNIIVDVEIPSVLEITNKFVKEIFVGKNFIKDQEKIFNIINTRYFGASQKSLMVAYKDAIRKYITSKN